MNTAKKNKTKVNIDAKLDLHGYTIEIAHAQTQRFIERCRDREFSNIEIITGKSGQIKYEFPFWLENFGVVGKVSSHGGSFIIKL